MRSVVIKIGFALIVATMGATSASAQTTCLGEWNRNWESGRKNAEMYALGVANSCAIDFCEKSGGTYPPGGDGWTGIDTAWACVFEHTQIKNCHEKMRDPHFSDISGKIIQCITRWDREMHHTMHKCQASFTVPCVRADRVQYFDCLEALGDELVERGESDILWNDEMYQDIKLKRCGPPPW